MKRSFYLLFIFLITGIFAIIVTVNGAQARPMPKPTPKPAEMTTVKGSKSNTSEREVHPTPAPISTPAPVEGTTVKSGKSNSSDREIQPTPDSRSR